MSTTNIKKTGVEVIQEFLTKLPDSSGVYQMYNNNNQCLYIGKAKNLRKRVQSYTKLGKNSNRIEYMISQTAKLDFITTRTEAEALLLEADLIKNLHPKYNILLRDDKTFPFIHIDLQHKFPRISRIRTKDNTKPNLFGPFSSSQLVNNTISFIQKIFKLRVCSNHNFNNRSRPCIYYQIKMCSAPCVGKISQENYNYDTKQAIAFLKGENKKLREDLCEKMNNASKNNNFEDAIIFRERIKMLNQLDFKYNVILPEPINADFIAVLKQGEISCIQIFIFRNGRSHGSLSYFPEQAEDEESSDILNLFLLQYYKQHGLPNYIYCNILPKNKEVTIKALQTFSSNKVILNIVPNNLKSVMQMVIDNANLSLEKHSEIKNLWSKQFSEIAKILKIDTPINRIEVYDNSHFGGSSMLGVMICAEITGFNKKEYRVYKLNNKLINPNDDYGTLYEVLTRRLKSLDSSNQSNYPSLLFIDGGKGQLNVALKVLKNLNITNIKVAGIAKGDNRRFGAEKIILENMEEIKLKEDSPTLRFILKLRDEAHRFAITTQRKSNIKKTISSELDIIKGIGPKRKQALLNYFGSLQNIKNASVKELQKVKYIDEATAKKILEWLK